MLLHPILYFKSNPFYFVPYYVLYLIFLTLTSHNFFSCYAIPAQNYRYLVICFQFLGKFYICTITNMPFF